MKNILKIALFMFFCISCICKVGRCDALGDQWQTALFGHMESIVESKTNGTTVAEFLATPIQIGQMNNEYLLGIDGGVLGNIQPQPGQGGLSWTAGVHFHLSPLLKKYIFTNLASGYPAVNGFEINPRYSYDFTSHSSSVGLGVGWAFGLSPLQ